MWFQLLVLWMDQLTVLCRFGLFLLRTLPLMSCLMAVKCLLVVVISVLLVQQMVRLSVWYRFGSFLLKRLLLMCCWRAVKCLMVAVIVV